VSVDRCRPISRRPPTSPEFFACATSSVDKFRPRGHPSSTSLRTISALLAPSAEVARPSHVTASSISVHCRSSSLSLRKTRFLRFSVLSNLFRTTAAQNTVTTSFCERRFFFHLLKRLKMFACGKNASLDVFFFESNARNS